MNIKASSIITNKEVKPSVDFPLLREDKDKRFTVLFFTEIRGLVVHSGPKACHPLMMYHDCWICCHDMNTWREVAPGTKITLELENI